MILTCPNCGTQYVVKDGAIPPHGRQVRCAACKHSWHEDPVGEYDAASEPEADDESLAEATLIEPRSGPEAEQRSYDEAMLESAQAETFDQPAESEPGPVTDAPADPEASAHVELSVAGEPSAVATDWREPPEVEAQDDRFSPFPRPDEIAPRRRSPLLTILLIVIIVAALAAAFWFLAPPEWKARLGIAGSGMSPLALVTTHMDRQRLESGNELLTVTGRVINPTSKDQSVPPLQAELKTRAGQIIYRWTIEPPAPSLPPGASASFNSTKLDVPAGGDELTITLGPPGA
jgi:predicted Zn finger-like uncharacterized protein